MSPLLGSIGGLSEYSYRGTLDDWPNPFFFENKIDVDAGSIVGVSTIITGINYKASVTSSGGSLISSRAIIGITSIYSGDSNIPSNTVTVSIANSTTELSVGKNIRISNASDPTYNGDYVINSVSDPLDPYVSRFTYIVDQVPQVARPGISSAQFDYEVFPFTLDQQIQIRNNEILEVRFVTDRNVVTDFDRQYRTTVRVGKRYSDWAVRTKQKDNTPDPFFFNNVNNLNIGIATTSNSITISGLEPDFTSYAFISSGIGSFSVNGSVGVTTADVENGDEIFLETLSSEYYSTPQATSITVGTYTTTFTVTTRPPDITVDQFFFNNLFDVPINQDQVSISTSLTGADNNIPLPVSISSPGELKINSEDYIVGSTETFNGDTLTIKIPASAIIEFDNTYTTQVTVSGVSTTFSVTTRPRPLKTFPNQFNFNDILNADPNKIIESSVVTLTGMSVGIADTGLATISSNTGSQTEFRVFRNNELIRDYDQDPFPVKNLDQVQLRLLSASEGALAQSKLTIFGIDTNEVISGLDGFTSDTWDVTSRNLRCKIDETPFRNAFATLDNANLNQLVSTSFIVSGLDNLCDTVITTSHPDSYIRNQNGIQVGNLKELDIKNDDVITIFMTAASSFESNKITVIEAKRKNGTDVVSEDWLVRTRAEDKNPDNFLLSSRSEFSVSPCTYRSTFVTQSLSGLTEGTIVPATVSSTNGTAEISKNGGAFSTSIPGGVKNGDRIDIRMRANCSFGGPCETATVTVGERTDTWGICPQAVPFPTVTLRSSSISVPYGGSINLTWNSTDATVVSSSSGPGFSGITATSGTIAINNLTSTSTFSITVSNSRGSATSTLTVTVSPIPSPVVNITAQPGTVIFGSTVRLSVAISYANNIVSTVGFKVFDNNLRFIPTFGINGGFIDVVPTELGLNVYSITVSNSSGVRATSTVNVYTTLKDPSVTLTANPTIVPNKGSTTLTWSSSNATQVVLADGPGFTGTSALNGTKVVTPTVSSNYYITVRNAAGKISTSSVFVKVSPPTSPTVTLTSNPTTIISGNSCTLSWSSTNATQVVSTSGTGFSNVTTVSGTRVVTPTTNTTYSITVRNSAGQTATASFVVKVAPPPAPTVTLTSNPTTIISGNSCTLTWSSTNATQVVSTTGPGFTGITALNGSKVVSPTTNSTYTITVRNSSGATETASFIVKVAPPPAPTVTLTSSPSTITTGGSSTLTWSSTNATQVVSVSGPGFTGITALNGSKVVSPTSNSTYTITVRNSSGVTASASANVFLSPPVVVPTVTLSSPDITSGSSITLEPGDSLRLNWTSTNATSVSNKTGQNFNPTTVTGSTTIRNITQNTTYSITVTGPGGSKTSNTITVNMKSPTVTLSSPDIVSGNSISLDLGDSLRLNWISDNATSVFDESGQNFFPSTVSGSVTVRNITQNTTYSITVLGPGGTATSNNIIVSMKKPTVKLNSFDITSGNSITLNRGDSLRLNWSSDNATSVSNSTGQNFTPLALNAETVVPNITENTSYSISVTGPGGTATSNSISVKIKSPSIRLSSPDIKTGNSITISPGGSLRLQWDSDNATSVSNKTGQNFNPTTVDGSTTITNITQNTTYSISVTGPGGTVTSNTINVLIASPTVILTSPDIPTGNSITISPGRSLRLNWSSTNATSITSYSGFGFIPKTLTGSTTINNINQNTSYSMVVNGIGGSRTSNTLSVIMAKPRVSLSASLLEVENGGSVTISWNSIDATSVKSSNFGASSVNGSVVLSNLTSTTSSSTTRTYNITVSGPGGEESDSLTITILPPNPTITLIASPTNVSYNGSTTLTWTSLNATSVSSNFGAPTTRLNGSITVPNLTSNKTFTITANGSNSRTATASANVIVSPPPPTVELCARRITTTFGPLGTECGSSRSVGYKETFVLEWTTTNATSISSYSGSGFVPTTTSGSIRIENITSSTTYSITVRGPGGTSTDSITVNPQACVPETIGTDSFANYKLARSIFGNGTVGSFYQAPIGTKINSTIPGRSSSYTYALIHSIIYNSFRRILTRPPSKADLERYVSAFINNSSSWRLDDLYNVIGFQSLSELNSIQGKGGIVKIEDTCSNNWLTSSPNPSFVSINYFDRRGIYLDLRGLEPRAYNLTLSVVANDSDIFHSITIPNLYSIAENSRPVTLTVIGGGVYGPCTTPNGTLYIGNETPSVTIRNPFTGQLITRQVNGSGTRPNTQLVVEEGGGDDWNDMVISTNIGRWTRFN